MTWPQWRYADGLWPNAAALAYCVAGYGLGLVGILQPHWLANLLGCLLLAHAMVIAAYMIHECGHNTVFKQPRHNAALGRLLNWLTGACYGDFEALRHKHFRHHVDKADIIAFDYRRRLQRRPILRCIILGLEWLYIPAVDILMHTLQILLPFLRPGGARERQRLVLILTTRVILFAMLALYSLKAALLYLLAYALMLHVLRFMDAFQHTFELHETLGLPTAAQPERRDRDYEHRHTYSNLISRRHPWLNLLVLNFCYHNAHHFKQAVPWYRLPTLHSDLYGEDDSQIIPFSNQLWSYHHHRVQRVLNNADAGPGSGSDKGKGFVGADGVNFLTAF